MIGQCSPFKFVGPHRFSAPEFDRRWGHGVQVHIHPLVHTAHTFHKVKQSTDCSGMLANDRTWPTRCREVQGKTGDWHHVGTSTGTRQTRAAFVRVVTRPSIFVSPLLQNKLLLPPWQRQEAVLLLLLRLQCREPWGIRLFLFSPAVLEQLAFPRWYADPLLLLFGFGCNLSLETSRLFTGPLQLDGRLPVLTRGSDQQRLVNAKVLRQHSINVGWIWAS
mmetsp:Transcript_10377/g.26603  ORF Transcript_10377/g.26603 Transcript_10377/m.26603 type:complete len:220 (+) Transcript_10377:296-955(+)